MHRHRLRQLVHPVGGFVDCCSATFAMQQEWQGHDRTPCIEVPKARWLATPWCEKAGKHGFPAAQLQLLRVDTVVEQLHFEATLFGKPPWQIEEVLSAQHAGRERECEEDATTEDAHAGMLALSRGGVLARAALRMPGWHRPFALQLRIGVGSANG